jgi:uncharacterized RDD family membrane protein YckC
MQGRERYQTVGFLHKRNFNNMNTNNFTIIDSYTVATPSQRLIAGIIDLVIYAILSGLMGLILSLFGLPGLGQLIGLAYLFFRDSFQGTGYQSLGKKVVRLKVLHHDTKEISYLIGLKRNFIFIPNLLSLVGIFFMFYSGGATLVLACIELFQLFNNKNYQRLGDRFANTTVIQLNANV